MTLLVYIEKQVPERNVSPREETIVHYVNKHVRVSCGFMLICNYVRKFL